jgi:hypothetical protein
MVPKRQQQFLEYVITEDDLEDEDCLAETLNDIKELCQ